MTVSEVGVAFEESLKIDKNGACFVVAADCPIFEMPCVNQPMLDGMMAFGRHVLSRFKIKYFNIGFLCFFVSLFASLFIFVIWKIWTQII